MQPSSNLPSIDHMLLEIERRKNHVPYQLLLDKIEDIEYKTKFIQDIEELLKIAGKEQYDAIISTHPDLDNKYLSILKLYCRI